VSTLPNNTNKLSILVGNGDGSFRTAFTSNGVYGLIGVGNFTGDGTADLAVTVAPDDSVVGVLLGNGDGTFRSAGTYAAGGQAVTGAVADFNGDGKLDLAVGSSFTPGSDDLNVYMNETPAGSDRLRFTHQVLTADPGIEGITAADFTGNGQSDIAYAAYRSATGEPTVSACGTGGLLPPLCQDLGGNGLGGDVGVLLNTTPPGSMTASFAAPLKLASGLGTVAVISGDFNGDGKPDIAAANVAGTGPTGVTIFTNQTQWAQPPVIPAQPVPGIGPGLGL
jgi:FG-GAP-like repeat/FG-GAP repeat